MALLGAGSGDPSVRFSYESDLQGVTEVNMELGPGTSIAHYEVLSLAGAGGMGEVYLARDTQLKREVALKVLPDSLTQDSDGLTRFQREAPVPD